jgi:hypothetical protein
MFYEVLKNLPSVDLAPLATCGPFHAMLRNWEPWASSNSKDADQSCRRVMGEQGGSMRIQMITVPSALTQISPKISSPFLSVSSVQTLTLHSPTGPVKNSWPSLALNSWVCGLGPLSDPLGMRLWFMCAQLDVGLSPFLPPSYTWHPAAPLGCIPQSREPLCKWSCEHSSLYSGA